MITKQKCNSILFNIYKIYQICIDCVDAAAIKMNEYNTSTTL